MTGNYLEVLKKVVLFHNIEEIDFNHLINCLEGYIKVYEGEEIVFSLGDKVGHIGIVIEGQAEIAKENLAGDRNIVAILETSHIFGEGIVCTARRISPVTVRTKGKTKILFIPYEKVITSCGNTCTFHIQLIKNMLMVLGEKNYALNNKIDYLILKGMRKKLITYLLAQAKVQNSMAFNINLNRNELAEYLNVSRSAMSRELSRMKEEKLIDYYKNGFKIMNVECLREFII
ncbi:MAG: Crp/Fnr family transcriptional regulator [Clostridium sp.]